MKNIFYWSPFTSKVATVKSVINSAEGVNKFCVNKNFKASIIDAVHEWKDYKVELDRKKIELIDLNKDSIFNSFKKDGFIRSRFAYWYIFFKSYFPLNKILKEKNPEYLIIHLITSLPLFLFIFNSYKTKLILRISGLPKMTILRKLIWKLASKNIYKITCPTIDTYKDLSKISFLKNKLFVLNDPIININDIQKTKKKKVNINNKLEKVISNENFLLSIGRFTKQKNFIFYLKCIPQILKLDQDLKFLIIGEGEDKEKFLKVLEELNLSDKVFILERTDNVHYFMKKAKALVLPSLWEDPGFVIVEAGLNNCQVISSNCPNGPSEIISQDGGYLFESNSESSLINSMSIFLNDNPQNRKLKKIILKKRLKRFTSFHHSLKLSKNILN